MSAHNNPANAAAKPYFRLFFAGSKLSFVKYLTM